MFSDINEHVRTCVSCQRSKRSPGKPAGLLQPLHIPQGPWDSVSTDFVTGLPKTKAGFFFFFFGRERYSLHKCNNNNLKEM